MYKIQTDQSPFSQRTSQGSSTSRYGQGQNKYGSSQRSPTKKKCSDEIKKYGEYHAHFIKCSRTAHLSGSGGEMKNVISSLSTFATKLSENREPGKMTLAELDNFTSTDLKKKLKEKGFQLIIFSIKNEKKERIVKGFAFVFMKENNGIVFIDSLMTRQTNKGKIMEMIEYFAKTKYNKRYILFCASRFDFGIYRKRKFKILNKPIYVKNFKKWMVENDDFIKHYVNLTSLIDPNDRAIRMNPKVSTIALCKDDGSMQSNCFSRKLSMVICDESPREYQGIGRISGKCDCVYLYKNLQKKSPSQ